MSHSPETLGGKTAPKWAWKSAQSFVRNEIKVWDRVLFSDTKLPDLLRDSVPIILLLGSNCQYFILNHSSARQKREWAVNVSDSVPTTRILAVSLGGALSFAFIKKICMNYCCFIPHPTVLKTTPYMRVRCILVKKLKNPVKPLCSHWRATRKLDLELCYGAEKIPLPLSYVNALEACYMAVLSQPVHK